MIKLHLTSAAVLALALTACSGKSEDKTLEVGATDEGGGELIARQPSPDEVHVDLPDTPMTPVPEGGDGAGEGEAEGE